MGIHSASIGQLSPAGESSLSLLPRSAIEGRLAELIRAYARQGSSLLAQAVVHHLEALCGHPDLHDANQFCAYRRLARHWRWLADAAALGGR